jgi:hypothetical protein
MWPLTIGETWSANILDRHPAAAVHRLFCRDEGSSFEAGSQVLASNRCKLLSSKAMAVSGTVTSGGYAG